MTQFQQTGRTAHLSASPVQILSIDQKKGSYKFQTIELQVESESGRSKLMVQSSPFRIGSGPQNDLVLDDPYISDQHCRLRLEEPGWMVRDLASTNGVYINGNKVTQCKLNTGTIIRLGKTNLKIKLVQFKEKIEPSQESKLHSLVGRSRVMRNLFSLIQKLGPVEEIVLIQGESGTGKELVAKALHQSSPRLPEPFVAINCGAISKELIESELFGHVKGAFTGAQGERAGVFEAAKKGTLFLDEIGELPLDLQPKLLRVLEEKKIRRVGSNTEIPVHCRVVAATHRDLEAMVKEKTFRQDLYYRLNILHLDIPPLREHMDDLSLLVEHLLGELGNKKLSPEALEACARYDWPGNVRELKNMLKSAFYMSASDTIQIDDLRLPESKNTTTRASIVNATNVEEAKRDVLIRQLKLNNGNKKETAKALGVAKSTLFRLLKKFNIDKVEYS